MQGGSSECHHFVARETKNMRLETLLDACQYKTMGRRHRFSSGLRGLVFVNVMLMSRLARNDLRYIEA